MTAVLSGEGFSAIGVSADIPDLHVFCGSFGGKDVMPLYRDREGKEPNITGGLLDTLGAQYGETPTPDDLAAYVYALLGGQCIHAPIPKGAGDTWTLGCRLRRITRSS